MEFIINGKKTQIEPQPGEMLVDMLRERLGLTGTKVGCNESECGACTVLIEGEPVLACTYPLAKAQNKRVWTIEGLAQLNAKDGSAHPSTGGNGHKPSNDEVGKLHPLQQAFIMYGAVQCGFCIPGQLMTSFALLQKNPDPSEADIRYALKDTLCRCAGYPTIIKAIQAAAEAIRTGNPVRSPVQAESKEPMDVIGRLHARPDAVQKVTGSAIYTDDLHFPDMLEARAKRSGIPHGILRRLDVSKARALPGVAAVLTAEDIPGEHYHGLVIKDWPTLVGIGERVRYIGDSVAIVAAETKEIAEKAIGLIEAEYELHPVVSNPVDSLKPETETLHTHGNLLKHIKVRKGDIEAGFEASDVILEQTFNTAFIDHAFLEPECSVARMTADGRMEVYVGSQIPYSDRHEVARALGWPEDRVRVVGQLMGGGFGGKEDIMGQIHAALLAHATKRPVKLLFDRHESLLVHPKRHATQIKIKMGAKLDGSLVAVQTELFGDTGAYASLGEKVLTRSTTHSTGPYEMPHVKADCFAMYTNNPPAGAFRGFGVTQSAFAIETMMDMLAEHLNLDRVELRRKNALRVGSITNTGQHLTESVGLLECIDKVVSEIDRISVCTPESRFSARPVMGSEHLVRAWGLAVSFKNTGLGGGANDKAGAEVELYADGTLEVRTSSAELGQGLVTILQLIVAQEFNLSPERVRVLVMDTDLTPDGGPTTASRQTYVSGNAALHAARTLRQAMANTIAEKYDVDPDKIKFVEGLAVVENEKIPLGDVAGLIRAENREPRALYEYLAPATSPLGTGGKMHFAYSFAAQAAEVEVNTKTGEVRVIRVVAANDVGKALNPLGLQGQVEGGVVMGLGNALTEHFIVEDGIVVTDRMARYRVPTIVQSPEIISFVVEHPTADGPYGAKGVGEIVSIPTTPAITNAIYNAVGVRIFKLPVDQEMIVQSINSMKIPM